MTLNETLLSLAINSWINGNRVVWTGANLSGANLIDARIVIGGREFRAVEEADQ
jgi:hypothetical protein